jgi:RNA polymerase sigma-70 factor (sigma-E family)
MSDDADGYREWVGSRLDGLRRTAYLLCGDWHTADDLVSTALVALLRHWRRVQGMAHPDAYARQVLLRAWLDERRRPWRRERSWAEPPEPDLADHRHDRPAGPESALDRLTLLQYLDRLPPRRRAVLVLRYFCELTVEETAEALGISPGTVKSQTARALDTLRIQFGGSIDPERTRR